MAEYTYLELCNQVTAELGLPVLSTIENNPNQTARQIGALMNRSGDDVYQAYPWRGSQDYTIINIGAPVQTTGDLVAGDDHIYNVGDTSGIVANQFAITGSTSSSETGIQQAARVVEVGADYLVMDMPALSDEVGAALVIARDTYAVPDAFKWFANETMWDRTNHWQLVGPLSPQAYQWLTSGIVPTGPRRRWRQVGTDPVSWRLWPAPTAPNSYPASLVFEYNSKFWARAADGTSQQWLVADDDYPVIDGQALVLHTKWRWLQTKGFEYGAQQAEAVNFTEQLAARDAGAADLRLDRRRDNYYLLNIENVPDGSWPGPGNGNP